MPQKDGKIDRFLEENNSTRGKWVIADEYGRMGDEWGNEGEYGRIERMRGDWTDGDEKNPGLNPPQFERFLAKSAYFLAGRLIGAGIDECYESVISYHCVCSHGVVSKGDRGSNF